MQVAGIPQVGARVEMIEGADPRPPAGDEVLLEVRAAEMAVRRDAVIVTGSSGFIGNTLLSMLAASFGVIGLDRSPPKKLPSSASFEEIDLTSDERIILSEHW
jgi:hypothetical protein